MFEKAIRRKIRFASNKGMLTTEDLWDLSLGSLNNLAKSLNKQIKASEEEDFLATRTVDDDLKLGFDVVLHVLNTKKAEQEAREAAADKAAKKAKLLEILERKQDSSLEAMSEEEIKAQLSAL